MDSRFTARSARAIIMIAAIAVLSSLVHETAHAQACNGTLGILVRGPIVLELRNNDQIRGRVIRNTIERSSDGRSSEAVVTLEMFDRLRTLEVRCSNIKRFYRDSLPPEQLGVTVTGRVVGLDGRPLKTFVNVEGLDTAASTGAAKNTDLGRVETDEHGVYTFSLPLGRYYSYYFEREGYYPIARDIDMTDTSRAAVTIQDDLTFVSFDEMREHRIAVRMNNLFFQSGSAKLRPASYPELDRAAAILVRYNLSVFIEGHTDNVGGVEQNLRLSESRARAVCTYLSSRGCRSGQLIPVGHGEGRPVGDNATTDGRAMNRRVELRLADDRTEVVRESE